jgi:RNA polymerase sigma factor (sigma-70 family)
MSRDQASPVEASHRPGSLSDTTLLARCRAGQTEAWDVLIDRYERLVYSVALRNGLGPVDAVDVAQTTFMRLLESSTRLRNDESLASWLMTVARRQSWRVRAQARREIASDVVVPLGSEPPIDWELAASVHAALQALGSPCRDLLLALYFDPAEPSYAEVARRLNRSIGGIGPLRGRCLERMRGLLAEGGHHE